MKINPKKCGILFLGNKYGKKHQKLVNIDAVDSYRFLGI